MKSVVIGIGSGASMETIITVYPRHKALVDRFSARGEVIGIGPFTDKGGRLAIFRNREAAESFVKQPQLASTGLQAQQRVHSGAYHQRSGNRLLYTRGTRVLMLVKISCGMVPAQAAISSMRICVSPSPPSNKTSSPLKALSQPRFTIT